MIDKIKALWAVFHTGEMVANPVAWKRGQITAGALTAFLVAVVAAVKVFGYDLHITDDQLLKIAGGCIALLSLFQPVATVVSTDKLGLQPRADGRTDAPSAVDSPSVACLPAVSAPAPAALQPKRQYEPPIPDEQPIRKFNHPAESERVDSSFNSGG